MIIATGDSVTTTPAPTYLGYDQVKSTLAKVFRDDIAPLRSGDPDGLADFLQPSNNNDTTSQTEEEGDEYIIFNTSSNNNNTSQNFTNRAINVDVQTPRKSEDNDDGEENFPGESALITVFDNSYIKSLITLSILMFVCSLIAICCCCPCLCGPLCCPLFYHQYCYNGCLCKLLDKCKIRPLLCCCCRPFCCGIVEMGCNVFSTKVLSFVEARNPKLRLKHSKTYFLYSCGLVVFSIIMWQTTDRLIDNNHLYENIFDVSHDYSFHSEVVALVDDLILHFGNIEPLANELIDTVFDTSELVLIELENNTVPLANDMVNDLQTIVNILTNNFTNITFKTVIMDPFTFEQREETMDCTVCDGIPQMIANINQSIHSQAVTQVRDFEIVLNDTRVTNTIYRNLINQSATQLFIVVDEYIVNANATKYLIDDYFTYAEPYMKDYGNLVFYRLFLIPVQFFIIFLICTPLGMFCGQRFHCRDREGKCWNCCCCQIIQQCWDRCCLKLNWCIAICCGSGFLMLFLAIFVVFPVIVADVCVKLDDLEINMENSDLGQVLAAVFENANGNSDNSNSVNNSELGFNNNNNTITTLQPISTNTDEDDTLIYFEVLDACLYGNISLLTIFELQDAFDDYLELKDEIQESLEIDLTSYLEQFDRYFDQLDTVLELVDNSTLTWVGEFAVQRLNSYTDSSCYCPNNPNDINSGTNFTRQKLS